MSMTEIDWDAFATARIVDVITPTLMTVRMDDGRELQAVLSPELRHSFIREGESLQVFAGELVKVELSPHSVDKCRIVQLVAT